MGFDARYCQQLYEESRSRIKWDTYFYDICEAVSQNVQCPSRKLGAVIVRGRNIVSTGYNGPPSGFPHPGTQRFFDLALTRTDVHKDCLIGDPCPRKAMGIPSGQRLSLCPCAHAERNAIDQAAKMGHSTHGCILYLNTCIPCLDCAYSIVSAGIVEVVVSKMEVYQQDGFTGDVILKECGVKIREFELEAEPNV